MINIGVQQKGIESLVPTGFSSDGMALMCYVLPQDEEEEFLSFYSHNEATGDYILKSDELSEERAKELYQNGISSAVCIALEELERTNGKLSGDKIEFFASMGSVDLIYDMLMDMPEYPESEIERYVFKRVVPYSVFWRSW